MLFLTKTGERKCRVEHPLIVNRKDGSILVKVPAGEFEMGDGKEGNCPKYRVYLDEYYIGVYCITNRQYKRFVDETGHRPPDHSDYSQAAPIWKGKGYPKEKADHPVVCVSWDDAVAYCAWAGLRLPTEAQWEKGARGPGGYVYPWGNEWDGAKCRYGGNRGGETTSEVYGYPEGVSGYGCYNMSGNVWEWCSDVYDNGYYKGSPRKNPENTKKGSCRVLRGGSWYYDGAVNFHGAYRRNYDPWYRIGNRGLRAVLPRVQQ